LRIAVLADPHSNLHALIEVLTEVKARKLSTLLLAGDLIGYGPNPNEVIALAAEERMIAIRGNHDDAALDRDFSGMNPFAAFAAEWSSNQLSDSSIDFLKKLPEHRILEIDGRSIGLFHGSPEDPYEYVVDTGRAMQLLSTTELDITIVGHTHIPMLVRDDSRLFVNPGGVGQPRDGNPAASFAEIDLDALDVQLVRVIYDIPAVQERMIDVGLPPFLASRLSLGY